ADPAAETIRGMDQCFALARSANAICGRSGNPASARLDCLRKARDAEEQCLEQVRAAMDLRIPARTPDVPTKPPNAERPQSSNTTAERPEKTSRVERPPAKLQTEDPAVSPARKEDAHAKPAATLVDPISRREPPDRPSSGWIVGETVSPVDFSPLLVAQINSVASNKPDDPSALVLRCRAGRTEMSLRTRGNWRAARASVVEVVFNDERRSPQRFRWRLASDGKSASAEDAINTVQELAAATVSISVNDGTGEIGMATFELAGIDVVRKSSP